MKRRTLGLIVVVLLVLSAGSALAVPTPEPAVVDVVRGGDCVTESVYDSARAYGGACERLKIVFGPIWTKPGQNDVLIQPVTFEKPTYDGYITRFKPDLVAADGVPPVEDVHLHHGTWLNAGRSYGSGPWIASGEEKTIAVWPDRHGLKVLHDDNWLFLHMVHNATASTFPVWVTYDIDYVPAAAAEAVQADGKPLITNTKQIWLDVGNCGWHPECDSYTANPIFNAQKGFGHFDAEYGGTVCYFPKENCARFNSEGNVSAQQGKPVEGVLGKDHKISASFEGTLVMMGGHVHNGGLRDEVSLVRDLDGDGKYEADEERPILISDAHYWDHNEPNTVGGPPKSWDFSMSGSSRDLGWAINVRKDDVLRLNGVYETTIGSWYEQMGIVMTWVVPGQFFGVDPFNPGTTIENGIAAGAVVPGGNTPGADLPRCSPQINADGSGTLCTRGQITHPHVPTSGNHATCGTDCPGIPGADLDGPMLTFARPDGTEAADIQIGGFKYGIADFDVTRRTGIPEVKVDKPVTFWNADTADYMWHTITRCPEPCTGATSASYPHPTAGLGPDDNMDFDSSELGIGLAPANRVEWEFVPDRTGTYTFFCRIHPSMRGAIKVVS